MSSDAGAIFRAMPQFDHLDLIFQKLREESDGWGMTKWRRWSGVGPLLVTPCFGKN